MEEAGILEKITRSGFCYPALNQVRLSSLTRLRVRLESLTYNAAGVVTLIVHLPNRGMKFLTKRHTGIIMGWVRASLTPYDVDRFGV
jgi:hypothetical protein